jgi:hypothetical protein
MPPATPSGSITLEFDRKNLVVAGDTDIRLGLSAVALNGDTLWLACDEGCRLERLTRTAADTFAQHVSFPLEDVLHLPADATEEADVEGMYVDDGWLWLVGSHSIKRKKPKPSDPQGVIAKALTNTSRDGNRHMLARLPIAGRTPVRKDGKGRDARRAAAIDSTPDTSALLDAIAGGKKDADEHLAPFIPIPGKDNGFDIEGLAVRGMRALIGLRGPVLREWACILEVRLDADDDRLRLKKMDKERRYRKHFVRLNGLGIRDLVFTGDDVLVLAGPSMAHDGPCEIWRWKKGANDDAVASTAALSRVLVLPQREGNDRAEGLTILEQGRRTSVMVVYDSPAPQRLGKTSLTVDVYTF